MKKVEAYWPLILLLAIIKFILPLFLQDPLYELQRDEYLYYQQGLHFDTGYLENPPLISYLGMISSWFGGSTAWIKLWPCLFGAATLNISCLIAAEFGGKLFAQFMAGLAMMTGAYMRIHFLFQPNFLDIFFWTLALYFIIRYINTKETTFIYGFAISLAFSFWSKYSVIFVAASLIISLLLTYHRTIFAEKKLYLAGALALFIIFPNVWWQYQHNWPLIHHMKELQETQLKFINPIDFLKDQLLMLIATSIIWIGGLIWLLKTKKWRFLGYTYFLVILLLILGKGKSYYSLGIYPMLLSAGAVAWENMTQKRYWLRYVISIVIVGFTWMITPMLLPIWKPEKLASFYQKIGEKHKWEDLENHPLPQDFADMLGWKDMTKKMETFYQSLPDSVKENTTVYCRHYGQAGSLKFYSKDKQFKEKVITDNGSFLLWIPAGMTFKNLLFIGHTMPGKDDVVFQHFEKITVIDSITTPYSRQFGDKIIYFENIDAAGLRLAIDGLNEMKKVFYR